MPRGKSEWEPGIPKFAYGDRNKYEVCDLTGCWIWFGALNSKGRPILNINGDRVLVYRYFWTLTNGPIPRNKELDHIVCDNKVCVNPAHLKLETKSRNSSRGVTFRLERLLSDTPF